MSLHYIFKTTITNYLLYLPKILGIIVDLLVMFPKMMIMEMKVENVEFFVFTFENL